MKNIVVIPSIADPRNTVTSIAMFQNAFDINPPMAIVVVYGTCPVKFRATGASGQPLPHWQDRWDPKKWQDLRNRFKQVADGDGIPLYFFDDDTQFRVWDTLEKRTSAPDIKLPSGITQEDYIHCVNSIFSATYSYGAQRNKAFMIANNLQADNVFFFDDDTLLSSQVGNMIDHHQKLLKRNKVYAVTGGYIGQRAFNTTIFRRIDQQLEFMALLGYDIPDDQATQDLWSWRMANGVLGGNFCIKKDVYLNICCPSMHRTPTTDDKLIGREILRVFGDNAQVYKTGWPVFHVHFPDRMQPGDVKSYLESWARTRAFWTFYERTPLKKGQSTELTFRATRGYSHQSPCHL